MAYERQTDEDEWDYPSANQKFSSKVVNECDENYRLSKTHKCSKPDDMADLQKRISMFLPQLHVTEQNFFDLVEKGDVQAVKDFLLEVSMFNINCKNFQGMTALHLAMERHNVPMAMFLLQQKNLDVTDCALHAIRLNQPEILVKILDRLTEISSDLEFAGCIYSPDFATNMTPLIVAAHCGNYEIIQILLDRNHRIPKPHKPCCLCEECVLITQTDDTIVMLTAKLDVYLALANPAYICHISSDPILHSFELSEELKECAKVHSIFKKEFLKILRDVEQFASDLLSCCRSCEEVNTLLSQREGSNSNGDFMFPRLILAMNLQQKEFVAKSNVQQVLEIACLGEWYRWKCYPILKKVLIVIPRIFMLPIIIAICLIAPNSKFAMHHALPINRLINHSASYLIFLALLYLQSSKDKTDQRKEITFTGFEIPIAIFVMSFIWKDFGLLLMQGPRQHFRFRWNMFKAVKNGVFLLYYILYVAAYWQVMKLPEEDKALERKYWHYSDPQLIAEALFAIATIMAYFELLVLIQVQEDIGPLQVSLGKMLIDCLQYAILFFIIIMSFNVGLGHLYSYYNGMTQIDPDTHLTVRQESPFTDPLDTLKFLFWGLFGLSDPDSANVVIENTAGEDGTPSVNEHYITEALGYYAFAVFMVLTVIIVLNMMIGTMANTYNKVIDNADVEWVFGRTEVYLAYSQRSILPPPFNLLPSSSCMKCPKGLKRGSWGKLHMKDLHDAENGKIYYERQDDYPQLMTLLIQRYFRIKDKEKRFHQPLFDHTTKPHHTHHTL